MFSYYSLVVCLLFVVSVFIYMPSLHILHSYFVVDLVSPAVVGGVLGYFLRCWNESLRPKILQGEICTRHSISNFVSVLSE